ncbi:Hypothetical predicted protein [Paramuricea clavata]|uniref:Uncharacterized protein n=1 Tax=Paramuricea clavata TaxID=317549 RepID=A0A7D9JBD2_PARCT|nr:Hypothetical predicted protein [Paramuricea clavata]
METTLADLRDEICDPYLDDIIVFSASFGDHVRHPRLVLERLKENGVKLKLKKCTIFKRELVFLGIIVSKDGYKLDPSTFAPILCMQETLPKTVNEVRKQMGFLNYYRRYIANFSAMANSIYDLVKTSEGGTNGVFAKHKKNASQKVSWTQTHQAALEQLLSHVTRAPVMAYPDATRPTILHTDASENGLGVVLYQKQAPRNRSGKHEYLALKWAICDHFRDYYSPPFEVFTDNNPLTYVLSSAKLNATGLRWIGELADFNFTIRYRPRKANADANTLSRMPEHMEQYMASCNKETSQDELRTIIKSVQLQDEGHINWISSLTNDHSVADESEPKLPSDN